ncbi:hypothetical protein EDB19DRAFT_1906802 [Suillus lakei]|nr:hypothetical protein EDB19DRAFT_1906802 [Suillus lakei]
MPGHSITPQKGPLEDSFSPSVDTLVGGMPSPHMSIHETPTLQAPSSSPNCSRGNGEMPLKKKHPLPESPCTLLIARDIEMKINLLEDYMKEHAGVCTFHRLSSSLPILAPHTDVCTCDLVNTPFYHGHYCKTIHRYINKPVLCSSYRGYKSFEQPIYACDNDSLQDFWLGIPYLIFTIPAISEIIFDLLGVQNPHEITQNIESFGTWLYSTSTYISFTFFDHGLAKATREAATHMVSLQPL